MIRGTRVALFPERELGPAFLFAEMRTVVREKYDNRVVGIRPCIESVENPAELFVGPANAGGGSRPSL